MMPFISPAAAQARGDRAGRGGFRRRVAGARRPAVVGLDPGCDPRGRPRGLLYWMGGKDTDEGALAGSRADERQQVLSLRSRALACNLAVIAAFIGLTAAIAVKAAWWWPFLVILAVAAFGYLLGLSNYGVAEQDPADDNEDPGQRPRSPVKR